MSASGIRGVVGEGLNAEVARRYGAAFGAWLMGGGGAPSGPVIVGRDSRPSGEKLLDAAIEGLNGTGTDVHDAGIAPTPALLLAAGDDPAAVGALIVTASHNPIQWNGLKLGGPHGRVLSPAAGRAVQHLYEMGQPSSPRAAHGKRTPVSGVIEHHVDRILALSLVDPAAVRSRRFLVALDCVRGAAGPLMSRLLESLGCRVAGLDLEPDGHFPREPEPVVENLGRLGSLVRDSGADLGMAVDPDGDRLALVDDGGKPIGEDWTLALAAEYVLARRPGPLVTNLSASQSIEDAATRAGVPCLRAPVGEAHVASRMEETGSPVGGEGNGGVILTELHLTRDAPVGAALVLSLLAERTARLSDLLAGWPRYYTVKRRVRRPAGPLPPALAALAEDAPPGAETDREDGLRLAWREAGEWVHVRASGTEPILRIIAEARSEPRATALADWAAGLIRADE